MVGPGGKARAGPGWPFSFKPLVFSRLPGFQEMQEVGHGTRRVTLWVRRVGQRGTGDLPRRRATVLFLTQRRRGRRERQGFRSASASLRLCVFQTKHRPCRAAFSRHYAAPAKSGALVFPRAGHARGRFGWVAEWSIAHAWKACLPQGNGGSNPPPSAPLIIRGLRRERRKVTTGVTS